MTEFRPDVARRQFVQGAGVAGLAGLAGCIGSDDDPEPSDDGRDDGDDDSADVGQETPDDREVADQYFTTAGIVTVSDVQYNPYNPTTYGGESHQIHFDKFAMYNMAESEFVPNAITDWTIEDESMTLTIREGLTWHDGEPVTSQDLATKFRLDEHVGDPMWDYATEVKTPDERTVELVLADQTNQTILQHTILGKWFEAPHSLYGEFLEAIEDASTDEEEDEAIQELLNWNLEDPLGCGPFELEQIRSDHRVYERVSDHPDAENVNFAGYEIGHKPGNQEFWQGVIGEEIEGMGSLFVPPDVVEKFPDYAEEILIPANWGMGLAFQHDSDVFGDRRVRQAIAHVVDRKEAQENSGPRSKDIPEIPCGITTTEIDNWLGDDKDDFDLYDDREKAAELLEEAGYTEDDGTWVDENGDPLRAPVKCPAGWSDWVVSAQTIVSQLTSFGIEAELLTVDTSTYWGKDMPNGQFELAVMSWTPGGAQSAFPYFPLRHLLNNTTQNNSFDYAPDGEVTVPARGSDGEVTVETHEKLVELSRSTDDEAVRELSVELAWVVNQDLPILPIQEKQDQSWLTADEWNVPSSDSADVQVHWPLYWLPRVGKLTAKTD